MSYAKLGQRGARVVEQKQRSRRTIVSLFALTGLVCICSGPAQAQRVQDTVSARVLTPTELNGVENALLDKAMRTGFVHGNEARDAQQLFAMSQINGKIYRNGGNSFGIVIPHKDVTHDSTLKVPRVIVATVSVNAAYQPWNLAANVVYTLIQTKNGNTREAALYDPANTKVYGFAVKRFHYKKLKGKVEPVARFEWVKNAANTVVAIGYACGKADWCLASAVGAADGDDPEDPDQTGDAKLDDGVRFRGYFDTAIEASSNTLIRVHPKKRLRKLTDYEDFDENDDPTAFIFSPTLKKKVFLVLTTKQDDNEPVAKWNWQLGVEGDIAPKLFKVTVDTTGADGMPFATRWRNSVVHTKAFTDGVWMRCAGGCCEANISFDF